MADLAQVKTSAVRIAPISGRTVLRLKSWLPEYANGGKAVAAAGMEFPFDVGATRLGSTKILCIGPAEWFVISDTTLSERLASDLPQQGLALVDLTDGLLGLEIAGPAVREMLSKGCGLDLHPRNFPLGRCARTRFAQIPVIIISLDNPLCFELYVSRSYIPYLRSWLEDAAVEFGESLS